MGHTRLKTCKFSGDPHEHIDRSSLKHYQTNMRFVSETQDENCENKKHRLQAAYKIAS